MVRACRLGDECRELRTFYVQDDSDPRLFCTRKCQRLAAMAIGTASRTPEQNRENGEKGAQALLESKRRRALDFIEGLTRLEVFDTGVRLGYETCRRERAHEPLGEIGRLTHDALRD